MGEFARPRGTNDLLPGETAEWREIEGLIERVFSRYRYREIRTPIFEHTEVFARGVGDTSDVVVKEMYTFQDRSGRSLTLRPEGTAGVVRAFVEDRLYGEPLPAKFYYMGPMFRYERPAAGRYRQFYQYGAELIGSDDPRADAEMIELGSRFLQEAGIRDARLEVNSVGCPVCRPLHREALVAHLAPVRHLLCADCQTRFDRNPLRILDCKIDRDRPEVRSAPPIAESLCADCSAHFQAVRSYLDELSIPYAVEPRMVRGLDYYTRTAFEFIEDSAGAQGTILGGGRYNGLVRALGGPELSGVGFAGGTERLLLARRERGIAPDARDRADVYVLTQGESARAASVRLLRDLRAAGLVADADYLGRSFRTQLKDADRLRARFALIVGDEEILSGTAAIRDMETKEQRQVPAGEVAALVAELIERERVERGAAPHA